MGWPPDPRAVGAHVSTLDTPCLVLDLDAAERNLDRMASLFKDSRVRVRPHTKTHKVPQLALAQMERGAIGVCCAKLGEAEVMAAGGVPEILLTTEVVGDHKIRRLLGVAQQSHVTVVVDDAAAAERLADAATQAGLTLDCLVDVNVGQNRTGTEPGEPALALAQRVERLAGLRLCGLQGYEGHLQHINDRDERRAANQRSMKLLSDTAELLAEHGLSTDVVSTAGTGTGVFAAEWDRVTEIQPGSYVVMDSSYIAVEGLGFESALSVRATALSCRGQDVIVDAGYKCLTTDGGNPAPRGVDATYAPAGDEHGRVTFRSGALPTRGDTLELIPSHCDTTINLYDVYYVTRGGYVVAVWPIAARGRSQ
ncbi:MAG: DSD1 family PLP-dependent enzyme [Chloroflexota bacterium]